MTAACSSSYTPGEKMLAYKKNMSLEQAKEVVQKNIWNVGGSTGICGSRGFWYDDESNMLVHNDKISLLAHKRGKQIKKLNQSGFDDINVFEKQYYKYDFEFNKLSRVNIYDDPLLLPVFPECNIKNSNNNYRIIDLYGDELNNVKFIVYEKDFDETMAALSILLPDVPLYIK